MYVVDTYNVSTKKGTFNLAKMSGIHKGDKIIEINKKAIKKIEDIDKNLIRQYASKNKALTIKIERHNIKYNKNVIPKLSKDKTPSLGLVLRDKITGIGTLTFYEPNSKKFGALGHKIEDSFCDRSSRVNGLVTEATITGINKSRNGKPGAKQAIIEMHKIGNIKKNTITGINGTIIDNRKIDTRNRLPVAKQNEVKLGKATILTSISNKEVKEFDIMIIELKKQKNKSLKGIKIKITDKELIEKTGGIVQGMSGSPIIQNGKIVGAVTHVTVENTKVGYGVYIEWMLQDAGVKIS